MTEERLDFTVHSGMDSFVLPKKILVYADDHLELETVNISGKHIAAVESLAQSGALHLRTILDFKRHVFLLGVRFLTEQGSVPNGPLRVKGQLKGLAAEAASYTIKGMAEGYCIEGELSFASVEYDENFRQNILEERYRELFRCLKQE